MVLYKSEIMCIYAAKILQYTRKQTRNRTLSVKVISSFTQLPRWRCCVYASLEGMEKIPNTCMQETYMHASCPLMKWRRETPNSLERLLQATSSSQFTAVNTARELCSAAGTFPQCKLSTWSGSEWHWFILDENPQQRKAEENLYSAR